MPDMLFADPTFKSGFNTTVRSGLKWAKLLSVGDDLRLCDSKSGDVIARGVFMFLLEYRNWEQAQGEAEFKDALLWEHDERCRTPLGLSTEMDKAYDKAWRRNPVLAIVFRLDHFTDEVVTP